MGRYIHLVPTDLSYNFKRKKVTVETASYCGSRIISDCEEFSLWQCVRCNGREELKRKWTVVALLLYSLTVDEKYFETYILSHNVESGRGQVESVSVLIIMIMRMCECTEKIFFNAEYEEHMMAEMDSDMRGDFLH